MEGRYIFPMDVFGNSIFRMNSIQALNNSGYQSIDIYSHSISLNKSWEKRKIMRRGSNRKGREK